MGEPPAPAESDRDLVFELMQKMARAERRPGETEAAAFRRLAETDPTFRKAYRDYREA